MTDKIDMFDFNAVLKATSSFMNDAENAISEGMKMNSNDSRIKSVNENIAIALHSLKKELGNGNPTTK